MSDARVQESLVALSQFFVGERTLHETLQSVSELTVHAVAPADLAGITMMVEGRHSTAVFTDPASPEIDRAQYESGEGPCLAAFAEMNVFAVESTREPGAWPAFRKAAAEHGIGSTLSLPLVVDSTSVGAMNLYSKQERAFSEEDRRVSVQFASQAAIVLVNSQAYWDVRSLGEHLSEAMKSRAVIEQAKGMLMAARRCDEDEAFNVLVRASQRENIKLRDIAARIVARAQQPASRNGGASTSPQSRPGS